MSITIRTFQPNDLEKIVALINSIGAIEKIEDGTSIEEMKNEIDAPGVNAPENVFVAEDENRTIVGYAWSRLVHEPTEDSFRSWFVVHPALHQTDLGTRLLTRMYTRAQERQNEFQNTSVHFHTLVNALERERLAVVQAFGMGELRRFWQMVRPLAAPLDAPRFSAGIVTRIYRVGEDDERVNDAVNEAFRDHFGHSETSIESWKHFASQPFFRPELTVIAEDTQTREIAGFSINLMNSKENERLGITRGWVDLIGVRRPWRQQGLGTALLLKSLQIFREAGLTQAALGCDSENITGATRIYERVGFRVDKTRIAFCKLLRGEQAP
jgi:mycothiol synthase